MADWMIPFRKAARGAPAVRVNSPVLARYLDDLAQQQRIADAAADARNLDIHFGRIKPDDPFAGVGDDPISDMVAATGAPRRWLEEADYSKTIESMMPSGPQEPFADALRRNERSRLLVNNRLDRLTPEEQVGSLGMVGRRADADAAMRRKQDIESDMDLGTRLGLATGAAALAGGFALKQQEDSAAEAEQEAIAREQEEELQLAMLEALSSDPDGAMPMTIDIGEDSPISGVDPLADMASEVDLPMPLPDDLLDLPILDGDPMPSVQGMLQDSAAAARNLPKFPMKDSFQRLLESGVYQLPSPEDTTEMSPGPESPVGMNRDLEDLPGPQMRSVRALMAAGIPEGRAMAIIVKGSSMSQDEYRMVTGGRR